MAKDNYLEFEGTVENLVKDKVFVKVDDNYQVICTLSGKIRQSGIKLLPFDRVKIEVSVYDMTKGRVTYRLRAG
jgi:translation initiation factor IF-1